MSTATLLEAVSNKLGVVSDAALARVLQLAPPVISKLRHGKLSVGPALLINCHEETGISIKDLKHLAGLPPAKPMRV